MWAKHRKHRKEIYEAFYSEMWVGQSQANGSNKVQGKRRVSDNLAFTSDTVTKTGHSERAIQPAAAIDKALVDGQDHAVAGHVLQTHSSQESCDGRRLSHNIKLR